MVGDVFNQFQFIYIIFQVVFEYIYQLCRFFVINIYSEVENSSTKNGIYLNFNILLLYIILNQSLQKNMNDLISLICEMNVFEELKEDDKNIHAEFLEFIIFFFRYINRNSNEINIEKLKKLNRILIIGFTISDPNIKKEFYDYFRSQLSNVFFTQNKI